MKTMNFCCPALQSKFSSSKPARDGHEVSPYNLYLEKLNDADSVHGFIGESFIRVPVDIQIDFKVPIDISCIRIGCSLASRISSGFSINIKKCSEENEYRNSECESDDIYLCYGKFFTKGESTVVLKNYFYKHKLSVPQADINWYSKSTFHGKLRNANMSAIKCASSVIIKIIKMEKTGVPVMQFLDIWGQPSSFLSEREKNTAIEKWLTRKIVSVCDDGNKNGSSNKITVDKLDENIKSDSYRGNMDIPEEFYDPITYEVMNLPILLPSGNSVDARTLEQFTKNESRWSRLPSDLFTGVPFSESSKPKPNIHLKARIDWFFLHCDESRFKNRPQTIGSAIVQNFNSYNVSKKNQPGELTSRLVNQIPVNKSVDEIPSSSKDRNIRSCSYKELNSDLPSQQKFPHSGNPGYQISSPYSIVQKLGVAIQSNTTVGIKRKRCFDLKASESKDSQQTSVFQSDPLSWCASNKCVCGCKDILYLLPCSHFLCRTCLTLKNLELVECLVCKEKCKKCDIKRHHTRSVFSLDS